MYNMKVNDIKKVERWLDNAQTEVIPEESAHADVNPEENVPVSFTPEENIPVNVTREENVPVNVTLEENVPVNFTPEKNVPVKPCAQNEENVPVKVTPEENVPVNVTPEENVPVNVTPEKNVPVKPEEGSPVANVNVKWKKLPEMVNILKVINVNVTSEENSHADVTPEVDVNVKPHNSLVDVQVDVHPEVVNKRLSMLKVTNVLETASDTNVENSYTVKHQDYLNCEEENDGESPYVENNIIINNISKRVLISKGLVNASSDDKPDPPASPNSYGSAASSCSLEKFMDDKENNCEQDKHNEKPEISEKPEDFCEQQLNDNHNNCVVQCYDQKLEAEEFLSVSRCESNISKFSQARSQFGALNVIQPQSYETFFYRLPLVREGFKSKLDKKKLQAYSMWLKCVEYQFLPESMKPGRKLEIVKKFTKSKVDKVFNLTIGRRNQLVNNGVSHVKNAALRVLQNEFAAYVNSAAYKNQVGKFQPNRCGYSESQSTAGSVFEAKSVMSHAQSKTGENPETSKLDVSQAGLNETDKNHLMKLHERPGSNCRWEMKSNASTFKPNSDYAPSRVSQLSPANKHSFSRDLNNSSLQFFEKTMSGRIVLQQTFVHKLSDRKRQVFKLWLSCIEHQNLPENRKASKKVEIVKKFARKDKVFNLCLFDRNKIVKSGISKVKETCFGVLKIEFANFVNLPTFQNYVSSKTFELRSLFSNSSWDTQSNVGGSPFNSSEKSTCNETASALGLQDEQSVKSKLMMSQSMTSHPSVASSTSTLQKIDQNAGRSASRASKSSGSTQVTVRDGKKCNFSPKYCSSEKISTPSLRSVTSRSMTSQQDARSVVSRASTRMSQSQRAISRVSTAGINLYERSFQFNKTVTEIFKMTIEKCGKKKYNAFKLWLKCVDYQYSAEAVKRFKKVEIKKKFVKNDDLFNLSVHERNKMLEAGVWNVKEAAMGVFEKEFAQFVGSYQYKNMCK